MASAITCAVLCRRIDNDSGLLLVRIDSLQSRVNGVDKSSVTSPEPKSALAPRAALANPGPILVATSRADEPSGNSWIELSGRVTRIIILGNNEPATAGLR